MASREDALKMVLGGIGTITSGMAKEDEENKRKKALEQKQAYDLAQILRRETREDEKSYNDRINDLEDREYKSALDREAEDRKFKRDKELQDRKYKYELRKARLTPKQTSSQKALQANQAKSFADDISKIPKVNRDIDLIDGAIKESIEFEKNSVAGTGPWAGWTFSNPLVNQSAENLDRKYKKISLEGIKEFAGMSKTMDSDAERKFYQQSQPDRFNRFETNLEILLGAKSLKLKQKYDAEAKEEWVRMGRPIDQYDSPVRGKMTTAINTDGDMELVPVGRVEDAIANGYMPIDDFVARAKAGSLDRKVQRSGLNPEQRRARINELRARAGK